VAVYVSKCVIRTASAPSCREVVKQVCNNERKALNDIDPRGAGVADQTVVDFADGRRTAVTLTPDPQAPTRILVVDDDAGNCEVMRRVLSREGHEVATVPDGESAIEYIGTVDRLPDLVLLDVMMPGISGFGVCRHIKQNALTRLVPVVMFTSLEAREHRIQGIESGADDFLSKPVEFEELIARAASLIRLKRFTDDLESAQSVIDSLALTVEARDPYTEGHCQRLAAYACALGRAMGLGAAELAALERGGYLHDVGKIGVADAILLKRDRLSADEFVQMQAHTIIGERLCGQLRSLRAVRPIVRHHHERLDGSGYPDGLRGDRIPLTAQIVGVVDAYDAMTTTRPYRQAMPASQAREELLRDAERGLHDREIVRIFVAMDLETMLSARHDNTLRFATDDGLHPERVGHPARGHRRDA
jgi:putative two-component system response regulator